MTFDPVAATDALIAAIPAATRVRANAYVETGHWVFVGAFLYGFLAKWLLLRSGWSARLRDLAFRLMPRRIPAHLVYGAFYVLILAILCLPWQVVAEFWRDRHYGVSVQSFGGWLASLKGGLIQDLILIPPLAALIFLALARAPRRWWLYAAGSGIAVFAFKIVILPLAIAPMYFTYIPIEPGPAHDAIFSLARANQIPVSEIYRYDLSKVTTFPQANVSGIGPTARIAVSDNLLDHGSLAEIRLVVGHEIGHYVMNHAMVILLEDGILIVALFALAAWCYPRLLRRWGKAWGVADPSDIAGLPALMIAILLFRLLLDPLDSWITRSTEYQADLFAFNATGEVDALPDLLQKVAQRDKFDPGRLEEILFFDHPSERNRILAAMRWKAEHLSVDQK